MSDPGTQDGDLKHDFTIFSYTGLHGVSGSRVSGLGPAAARRPRTLAEAERPPVAAGEHLKRGRPRDENKAGFGPFPPAWRKFLKKMEGAAEAAAELSDEGIEGAARGWAVAARARPFPEISVVPRDYHWITGHHRKVSTLLAIADDLESAKL